MDGISFQDSVHKDFVNTGHRASFYKGFLIVRFQNYLDGSVYFIYGLSPHQTIMPSYVTSTDTDGLK